MQMWDRKWLINFKTGNIRQYLVDFKTKHVHDPQRYGEICHQDFIKDGFTTSSRAKAFYEKYKDYYAKKMAELALK